ncbi:MAG: hypothetical protein IH793_02965 [Acidobacteria bacterium]|nr:hypothetical protein [Acidobacteriota bacterium]
MDQPLPKIAEALTGALSLGRSDAILAGGRLVQAALKGKLMKQVGREIKHLVEKGRINEDYANTKFGFKSLAELLEFIDRELPDEDRLRAVKAMFLAVNSVDRKEGEEILCYQLLQISMKLSASQLLVLKTTYDLSNENTFGNARLLGAREWLSAVGQRIGHGLLALIEQDESPLIANGLISERTQPDRSGVDSRNARLTDLGIKFCEYLVKYSGDEPKS